uniref:Secernin 1 n=1 Tax=Capra hircus TaxID=9925 RepID=A0A8C2NF54_CAPHI
MGRVEKVMAPVCGWGSGRLSPTGLWPEPLASDVAPLTWFRLLNCSGTFLSYGQRRVLGSLMLMCTYISINQVPRTHAIVISRPAWLWGAEMGANEHGVCIANEAVNAREPAAETEALLGMDLVRLGLERGATAKEALDVIIALLEEHGQGGNYYEDANSCHSFQSAYLIVDREEAWVLETVGKYWAAEKITEGVKCICNQLSLTTKIDAEHPELRSYAQSQGWWTGEDEFNFSEVFSPSDDHLTCCSGRDTLEKQEESITVQTMIDVLRDKASGVCVDSESFLTTASIVSVLPQSRSSPCVHYFTGTPDPSRSIFKPFIFVDDVKLVPKAQSPCFGDDDPAKKEPRFQEKPDRRHELYKAHEWARAVLESDELVCFQKPRLLRPEALARMLVVIVPASLSKPSESKPPLLMLFKMQWPKNIPLLLTVHLGIIEMCSTSWENWFPMVRNCSYTFGGKQLYYGSTLKTES